MQKNTSSSSSDYGMWIHSLIGVCFMLFGRYLPAPSIVVPSSPKLVNLGLPAVDGGLLLSITQTGMIITTIFIGIIYLWTTVDTLWPCFLGVFIFGISGILPMPVVLSKFIGNPMVVMIFFLLFFSSVLMQSGLGVYLANKIMRHPSVQGKPWMLTSAILLASYLIAFLDQVSACFLMLPVSYYVFEKAGYKKDDKYVSFMTVNIIMMALLSFASDPIKGGAFYLLVNLQNLAATASDLHAVPINMTAYLLFGIVISLVSIVVILFSMRYIFRVDVSPLAKVDMNAMHTEPTAPLNAQQKFTIILFLGYALWMLLPGIIGQKNPVGAFLAANILGGSLLVVFFLAFVRVGGKNLVDIQKTSAVYPWRILFLIAVAFLMAGAMSGEGTNVPLYMEYVLRDVLTGMSPFMLSVSIIILGIIITNFFNSVAIGIVLAPVLLSIAYAFNFDAAPVLACFFFAVLVAAALPSGSPYAAMLYDQTDWVSKKNIFLYASFESLIVVVVLIVVGIPFCKMMF